MSGHYYRETYVDALEKVARAAQQYRAMRGTLEEIQAVGARVDEAIKELRAEMEAALARGESVIPL